MEETSIEELGRWISGAEMWSQLLLSTSLEIPERVQVGIDVSGGIDSEEPGPDVISKPKYSRKLKHTAYQFNSLLSFLSVVLIRTCQLSAATELFLPKVIPTAFLSDISLNFLFNSTEPYSPYGTTSSIELMPQIDTAIRGLWNDKIAQLAPILGKIGYLESISQNSEYITVISDAIRNFGASSHNKSLGRSIEELGGSGGIERKVWGCLLRISDENKGRAKGTLKSLMNIEGDLIASKTMCDGEEQGVLFLPEEDFEEDQKEELFFDDISADENSFFTWDEKSECGEGGKSDSLFGWEDEDNSSLFETPRSPLMDLGLFTNENEPPSIESYELESLFAFETSAENVGDEDMIWI